MMISGMLRRCEWRPIGWLVVVCLVAPAAADGAADAAVALAGPRLAPAELAMWRSDAFKRQFVASYMAETEIEPTVTVNERKVMLKVFEEIEADRMAEAAELIRKRYSPASTAVFDFTLGNIHFQREELDDAAAAYATAVDKFPKFRRAWKNLAMIHVRAGRHEEAARGLGKVIELGGGDALTFGLMGYVLSNGGQHLAAETAYRMAMMMDPGTRDWKLGLAYSLLQQQRFADAAAMFAQMIEQEPQSHELWMYQANAFIGMNRPMDAAENYEMVDRLGHASAESLETLGDIYVNGGLFELAVGAYGRAMAASPDRRPDRVIRAAMVMTGRGALAETAELLEQIEQVHGQTLKPEDRKRVLKLQARIAVARGAGEEEAEVLREIVELDPLDGEALILLGQHAQRNDQPQQAAFYYQRAASIEAFEADAKIRHAQLLVSQGKYREAIPMLEAAQQIKPRENVQKYLDQVQRLAKS